MPACPDMLAAYSDCRHQQHMNTHIDWQTAVRRCAAMPLHIIPLPNTSDNTKFSCFAVLFCAMLWAAITCCAMLHPCSLV